MNTRFLLPVVALLALSGQAVQAATVSISVSAVSANPEFVDSLGGFLAAGDAVRVGIFNTSAPGSLATLQTDNVYTDVNALFTPFAEGGANSGLVNQSGNLSTNLVVNNFFGTQGAVFGQITGIDSNFCTPGTELALWVFNNADPTQATEWGIFTSTSKWAFPQALGSNTLTTTTLDNVIRGSTEPNGNFALSNISVVPEPGSWLLLMAGAVALTGRKRRFGANSAVL